MKYSPSLIQRLTESWSLPSFPRLCWVSAPVTSLITTSLKRKMSSSEEVNFYPPHLKWHFIHYLLGCRYPGSLGSAVCEATSSSARWTRTTSRTNSTWLGWTSRCPTTDKLWTWSSTWSLTTSSRITPTSPTWSSRRPRCCTGWYTLGENCLETLPTMSSQHSS